MNQNNITCEYCNALNKSGNISCIACGAPLPHPPPIESSKKTKNNDAEYPINVSTNKDIRRIRETSEEIDKVYSKARYAYSIFWRTLAESAVIAITTFAIGFIGGATKLPIAGILASILIGFFVGYAIKSYYFVILSAPLGLLIGTILGALLWALRIHPIALLTSATLFAIAASLLGSRKIPYKRRNKWEKIRPVLGSLGGLIFGLLGTMIGLGVSAIITKFIYELI